MHSHVKPLEWKAGEALLLLDQRILPHQEVWVTCRNAQDVATAIRDMVVRGAPAIGVSAAFGVALESSLPSAGDLHSRVRTAAELLRSTRPTAVNLHWALDRMLRVVDSHAGESAALSKKLDAEAEAIHAEDLAANHRIGQYGAELLSQRATVLTHCNAGALATSGYGTALGVIRAACEAGKTISVFADETRPFLQGSRLTAWELQKDGIDVTLITDSMAGYFFQKKQFDAVIVGADRIARNGDAANKIGTYTVAVLAHTHGIPFYVAAPITTIDAACASGADIPIEERSSGEVTHASGSGEDGQLHT
ncbi:MAG TPA: S-methyl-5-thioribose-1-phosphate isomerase, partial [Thermoanaerobaculia bacterium]|nr:S-methyl-5-thioribose-1-phosphate isomerase [Thermoanaerobaculia bacterium]